MSDEIRRIATKFRYNENAPAGAGNTPRGLTHSLDSSKEGLAMDATHKTCVKCGETKPLSEFPPRGKCRACCRRKQTEYRVKNRDRLLERKRKAYWRDVEETRRLAREYRRTNIETISADEAAWRRAHPEHNWKHHYIKRAKRFGVPVVVEPFSKADVVALYGDRCVYCGVGEFEHLDHYEPVSKGGAHTLANVRPSCAACNKSKHVNPGEDFERRNG